MAHLLSWLPQILLLLLFLFSLMVSITSGPGERVFLMAAAVERLVQTMVTSIVVTTDRLLKSLERQAERTRDWKEQLKPLTRYLPPANLQTIARGVVLNLLNWQFWHGHFASWMLLVYTLARLTDFTDGLTARYRREQQRLPANSGIGRYLDPLVDIPTDLATCLILWPYYHRGWLVAVLLGLTACRIVLFIAYRLWAWRANAPGILPPDIAGQSKAWFLGISFGLLILNRQSAIVVNWAEVFFSVALFLEVRGISNQFLSALRQRREVQTNKKKSDHS